MRIHVTMSLAAFVGFALWNTSLVFGKDCDYAAGNFPAGFPVQLIEVPTQGGHTTAAVRKPPGKGPFPAAIYLHGTLQPKEAQRSWHIRCEIRPARDSLPPVM